MLFLLGQLRSSSEFAHIKFSSSQQQSSSDITDNELETVNVRGCHWHFLHTVGWGLLTEKCTLSPSPWFPSWYCAFNGGRASSKGSEREEWQCPVVSHLWEVQKSRGSYLGMSCMSGLLFKQFMYRKFSVHDGWDDTSFIHLSLLLDSILFRAHMYWKPSMADIVCPGIRGISSSSNSSCPHVTVTSAVCWWILNLDPQTN